MAFVGVGSEFNADDLAGPLVVRGLADTFGSDDRILILDAGAAPENCTSALRRFTPDLVVLVDAVDMQLELGAAAWVDLDDLEGLSAFTHAPSPAMLVNYLRDELDCRLVLIGIQPGSLEFDCPPSDAVVESTQRVVEEIKQILRGMG